MTQPEDILDRKVNNKLVLIDPFLGHHMCEHALGVVVSNQQTFADEALSSGFFERGSPGVRVAETHVGNRTELLCGEEKVVEANNRDGLRAVEALSSSLSEGLSLDTLPAPTPERDVCEAVLFYLFG